MRGIFVKEQNQRALKIVYRTLGVFITICCAIICCLFLAFSARAYFYPIKYKTEIIKSADEFKLDRALVFAMVRVESRFNPNAKSDAGAKGLMQITDKTGEYIAEKLGVKEYDLFDKEISLRFGCYYIRYLLDKFEVLDTALAAYNAGEGNVKEWLKDNRYSDDGLSLKYVPYAETREYIKKIQRSFEKYKNYYKNSLDKRQIFE